MKGSPERDRHVSGRGRGHDLLVLGQAEERLRSQLRRQQLLLCHDVHGLAHAFHQLAQLALLVDVRLGCAW